MKILSKLKWILCITIVLLIIFSVKVNAANIQEVSNIEEYKNLLTTTQNGTYDFDTIKLTDNIDLTQLTESDLIYVRKNLTIDLNNHTLVTFEKIINFAVYTDVTITVKNGTIIKNNGDNLQNKNIIKANCISSDYNVILNVEDLEILSYEPGTTVAYMVQPENPSMMKRKTVNFNNVNMYGGYCAANTNFDNYSFSNTILTKNQLDTEAYLVNASWKYADGVVGTNQKICLYNDSGIYEVTDETTMDTVKTDNNNKPIIVRESITTPIQVSTPEELLYAFKYYPEADIKLTANITLSFGEYYIFVESTNKVIDLAGNTLDIGSGILNVDYKRISNGSLKITDTSNSKSGTFLKSPESEQDSIILNNSSNSVAKFTIDGGTYIGSTQGALIKINQYNQDENYIVDVKNAEIKTQYLVDYSQKPITLKVENIIFGRDATANYIALAREVPNTITYADVIQNNNKLYVKTKQGTETEKNLTTSITTSITSNTNDRIVIRSLEGFDIQTVQLDELVYGYSESQAIAKSILITNRGQNALQIKNVTVTGTDFIVDTTPGQPTLAGGESNSQFTIKAKQGLIPADYTATITVTDENDKTYTGQVKITVKRKNITATITMDGWKYGETANNPSATGEGLNEIQYEYAYMNLDTFQVSQEKPTVPGNYKIMIISNQILLYNLTGEKDFTISKADLNIAVKERTAEYDGTLQKPEKFNVTLNGTQKGTDIVKTPNNVNWEGLELVGTDKLTYVDLTGGTTYFVNGGVTTDVNQESLQLNNSGYYNITTTPGKLFITPRNITIKPKDITVKYNEDINPTPEVTTEGKPLIATDVIRDKAYKYNGNTTKPQYVGQYEITFDNQNSNFFIANANNPDESISSSYDITLKSGTLNINSKDSEITGNIAGMDNETNTPVRMVKNKTLNLSEYVSLNPAIYKDEITFEVTQAGGTNASITGSTLSATNEGTVKITAKFAGKDLNNDNTKEYNESNFVFYVKVVNKTNINLRFETGPDTVTSFDYNGEQQSPNVDYTYDSGTTIQNSDIQIRFEGRDGYNYSSKQAPVNAGKYTMIAVVDPNNSNYMGEASLNFEINKAQIAKPTASTTSYTYKGEEIQINISNEDLTKMNVTGNKTGTNVGGYTITYSLKDNYKWNDGKESDVVIDWNINKKQINIPTLSKNTFEYSGNQIEPQINGKNDTYITIGGNTKGTNAGTYNISFTLKDTNNTEWTNGSITPEGAAWEITKLKITKPNINKNDLEYYYNPNQTWTPEIESYVEKYMNKSGDLSKKDSGEYSITIELKDKTNTMWEDNTTDNLSLKWEIKKAVMECPISDKKTEASVFTYQKNFYRCYQTSYSTSDYIYYTINGKATSTDEWFEPEVDAGTYTYTASLIDKNNSEWEDGTTEDKIGTLTINKANGTDEEGYEVPTDLSGIKGDKLSTITLPQGFTWVNPDTVITDGQTEYNATYTPKDTKNYNVANNVKINIEVKQAYTINTSVNGGNGKITNYPNKIVEGTNIIVNFTPDEGYMIEKVTKNGVECTNQVQENKFNYQVSGNTTFEVKYKKIPFTITVEDVKGATVKLSGSTVVNYGEDKEIEITTEHGYKLIKILVDDVNKTSSMVGNTLTISNIKNDTNVRVVVERIMYNVVEGNKQNYVITENDKAEFRIEAEYSLFEKAGKVSVDNILLDETKYTSKSGSTVITLNKEFVDTLEVGKHILRVEFNDGGLSEAEFTVSKVNTNIQVNNENDNLKNPKTSDTGITPYIVVFIISVISLKTITNYKKRKH